MVRVLLVDPLAHDDEFDAALARAVPEVRCWRWPDGPRDGRYDVLAVWKLPERFDPLPDALALVFCFGAGADHLLADPRLPRHVPIVRLIDEGQAAELADYACHAAFAFLLNDAKYRVDQRHGFWDPVLARRRTRASIRVAVLGLGPIGTEAVRALAAAGFSVRAWSRTSRNLPGIETFCGREGLAACADGADVLVNLLPLHAETAGILSGPLFARLARGAYLVNLGRGGHLDPGALRAALDAGQLGCAFLDAFPEEPLPSGHWMWSHERVRVTPHIGGLPTPSGAARSLAGAIAALRAGTPLPGLVRAAGLTKTDG